RPAVLLLHRDAEQPHGPELRPQAARKLVGLVDLGRQRGDLVGGKAAHGGAQLVRRLAEVEVERGKVVGNHGPRLLRLSSWLAARGRAGKHGLTWTCGAAGLYATAARD